MHIVQRHKKERKVQTNSPLRAKFVNGATTTTSNIVKLKTPIQNPVAEAGIVMERTTTK